MLSEPVAVERVATPIAGESGLSCDDLANKIKVSVKKGDDYHNTAGNLLIEARKRLREFRLTFSAFTYGRCGLPERVNDSGTPGVMRLVSKRI
jgi:hypothetical protein